MAVVTRLYVAGAAAVVIYPGETEEFRRARNMRGALDFTWEHDGHRYTLSQAATVLLYEEGEEDRITSYLLEAKTDETDASPNDAQDGGNI